MFCLSVVDCGFVKLRAFSPKTSLGKKGLCMHIQYYMNVHVHVNQMFHKPLFMSINFQRGKPTLFGEGGRVAGSAYYPSLVGNF